MSNASSAREAYQETPEGKRFVAERERMRKEHPNMTEADFIKLTDKAVVVPEKSFGMQLKEKMNNFAAALPAHIPAERFARVCLTAVQNVPELLKADRASLFNACMRAAQDGLLPDGRDGALVVYNTKVKDRITGQWGWIAKIQWMPMIAGIRKKIRNSGEIAMLDAVAVHAKDEFEYERGTGQFLRHKPWLARELERKEGEPDEAYNARWREHSSSGRVIAFYSIATLKTGEMTFDVMTASEVEKVRDDYSKKNFDGAFSPAWVKSFDEMGKKTVVRRHSKSLPMSSDLDDLIRRDDALYDMEGKSDKVENARIAGPKGTGAKLDALLAMNEPKPIEDTGGGVGTEDAETIDPETGEVTTRAEVDTAASARLEAANAEMDARKREIDEATAKASQAAPEASTTASEAEGAGKAAPGSRQADPAPTDPHAALLADLVATGNGRADSGSAALRDFLENLETPERNMIPAAQVDAWVKTSKARTAAKKAAIG